MPFSSNFDSPMELRDKRRTLVACGPLNWDQITANEADLVAVAFTIVQGPPGPAQRQVPGDSRPGPGFGRDQDEWMVVVNANKQLNPGPASGHGELYNAQQPPGAQPFFTWDVAVALTQRDIPEEDIVAIVERGIERGLQSVK
jgi:hypothetical protein